jgi:hypothetical protein
MRRFVSAVRCRDASRDAGTAPNDEQIVYQINLEESLRHPSSLTSPILPTRFSILNSKPGAICYDGGYIEISDEYIFIAFREPPFSLPVKDY